MRFVVALAASLSMLGIVHASARAEKVLVDVPAAPGEYPVNIIVGADGKVTAIRPLAVWTIGGNPTNPPPTNPPTNPPAGPTAFEAEVERLTKDVLSKGGTKTTGAALSSVYSLVADEVAADRIAPANALPAIKAATDLVLAKQADAASWGVWRQNVGDALTILNQQGQLGTKEQVSAALKQIAGGLNRGTGFSFAPSELVSWGPGRVGIAKAEGILDGINIAQLVELIKLVMELLKLFGVGK